MRHQVVIIGGGFGGLFATRALKSAAVDVTLVDRRNFHLFQPLLYQVATGGLSPANIAAPLRGLLKRQGNANVRMGEVIAFDVQNRRAILNDHSTISYDTLIVAAGSVPNYFGHNEWEISAPPLKSMADAREIRRRVLLAFESAEVTRSEQARQSCLTFVVVGGGASGVELAGSLAELARHTLRLNFRHIDSSTARIMLIEGGDRILSSMAPELSAKADVVLKKLGIEIRTGATVSQIEAGKVTIKTGDQLEEMNARTVLWTAGVKASPLGKILKESAAAKLDKSGRVEVQADLTLSGHPEIIVIGDLACFRSPDGKPLPGVAQVAMQQGRYAADLIRSRLCGKRMDGFRYRDRGSMAVIGRNSAVADLGWLKLSGFIAWLLWGFIHLQSLVQFQNRVLVMAQWVWSYVTRNRSAILIPEEGAEAEKTHSAQQPSEQLAGSHDTKSSSEH